MKELCLKWTTVLETALEEIAAGKFAEDTRYYTREQLCEKFGISDITARRVCNELKLRGLLTKNRRGRALVINPTTVTDVFMCMRNEYMTADGDWTKHTRFLHQLLEGFTSSSYAQQYRITPIALNFLMQHIDEFLGKPVIISADSLLNITEDAVTIDMALLQLLRDTVNPIVFHSFGELPSLTQVGCDLYQGISKVTKHLIAAGHTRIGYITDEVTNIWFYPRFKGFTDALYHAGLPLQPALLAVTTGTDKVETYQALEKMLQLSQRPTAIVCANDTRALHVLEYCREHHITVPDTLAVTGFDNLAESALCQPPLTTLDGRNQEIGRTVLELVHKRRTGQLMQDENIKIEPELIVRASG